MLFRSAYKAIYGLKFNLENGDDFGEENVNIVLESINPVTFTAVSEEQKKWCIDTTTGAYILKNPNIPDSTGYLPYLYARFTLKEVFEFEKTGEVD